MAKYDIFKAMPIQQIGIVSAVARKSGHHYYFPNTTEVPQWTDFPMPLPKRVGCTARIFLFTTASDGWAEIKLQSKSKHYVSSRLNRNSTYEGEVAGIYKSKPEIIPGNIKLKPGSFCSLAVRVDNLQELRAFYDVLPGVTENVGDIMNTDFRIYLKLEKHLLLSFHVTIETSRNIEPWARQEQVIVITQPWNVHFRYTLILAVPNGPIQARHWKKNHDSLLWDRWLPLHTTAIYTVRPTTDNPGELYIELDDSGNTREVFSKNVKKGQELVYMVRLASNCVVITNDFNHGKSFAVIRKAGQHYMKTKFDNLTEILKVEVNVPFGSSKYLLVRIFNLSQE